MIDVIKKYAHPATKRTIRNFAWLVRRERKNNRNNRTAFGFASLGLALIGVVEYFIGYAFISYMLADSGEHPVAAPMVALIVPMAAMAYHLRTAHEGDVKLAKRLRAFVVAGILVLPVALSLGLAITMANGVGGSNIASSNSFLGDSDSSGQIGTGITDTVLGLLNGISPLLIVVAFATSLAISFFLAGFAFRKIEKTYAKIKRSQDRYTQIMPRVEQFQLGYKDYQRAQVKLKKAEKNLPQNPEQVFAEALFSLVNADLSVKRRLIEAQAPGAKNRDVFTWSLDSKIFIPEEIEDIEMAREWINRTRHALQPQAIVDSLGANPPEGAKS